MRGIGGIVQFDGTPVATAEVDRLLTRMAVGTYDRQQSLAQGSAGFCHLIRWNAPEERFEAQPIAAEGGLLLTADVLLENRGELLEALGIGPAEAGRLPDGELVLRAFRKWGEGCPAHLEGKFAFAVWDPAKRRLFCAVDAFAHRPFYYHHRGSRFAFATTIRGLMAVPGISSHLDDGVLADSLLIRPAEPGATTYADIAVIPGGHCLRVDPAGLKLERYWIPRLAHRVRFASSEEYVEAFSRELERAVAGGLRTERDVAIMVSGGLDSAAATVVAGKLLAERGRRLHAIHRLPPPGNADPRRAPLRDPDESRFVKLLERHAPHIDFHFAPHRMGKLSLANWDDHFDHSPVPFRGIIVTADPAAAAPPPAFSAGRMMYGYGGNYVVSFECAGNGYLPQLMVQLRWARLWREMAGQIRVYGLRRKHQIRHELLDPLLQPFRRRWDARLELLPCLNPDFIRRAGLRERILPPRRFGWKRSDFGARHQQLETILEFMPQQVGAVGSVLVPGQNCEGHMPYFDRRLNEFCLAVPVEQQISGGWDRLLLRRAMKGLLPDEVAWRVTRGFGSVGLAEGAAQLRQALPQALAEMRKSALAAAYLDLDAIERRFLTDADSRSPWMRSSELSSLFCLGWFLRWRDRPMPAG